MLVVLVVALRVVALVSVWLAVASRREARALRAGIDARSEALEDLRVGGATAMSETVRLERALFAMRQGVVIVDVEGEVVFRNAIAESVATGRHGDALVEGVVRELVAAAVTDSRSSRREVDLYGPPRRMVVVEAMPLLHEARAVGALAVIDDITERRQLEAVRRDFIANIGHELRTPVGALSLLAETLLAEDDEQIRDRLAGRILTEATRVAHTIEDLIQLSQMEVAESPERDPVAVHLIVAEAINRVVPAAEQHGVTVRCDEPSRRLVVIGDRRQLVSALANLIDNAVKYSDPGSSVVVTTSNDGVGVDIDVQDRGIGIPARDLERIFERFYRVDQGRSRQTGGTGLGLAIVRHAMTNHAGEVLVRSRLGEGSTFTLRIPLAEGPVAVVVATDAASA